MTFPGVRWETSWSQRKICCFLRKQKISNWWVPVFWVWISPKKSHFMCRVTPGLSGFWDQSQANSELYSEFWSLEPTDFKNLIVENIHLALSEDAKVPNVKWPRKRPLNLSSLGGFQIFNIQPPRPLTILKNESFPIRKSLAHFDQWKPLISKM